MIKSELIEKLAAENLHLTHAEVERVVNVILGCMTETPVSYTHLTLPTIYSV